MKKTTKFVDSKKNEVEVFRVFPEYKKLNKKRKKDALFTMMKWALSELESLN